MTAKMYVSFTNVIRYRSFSKDDIKKATAKTIINDKKEFVINTPNLTDCKTKMKTAKIRVIKKEIIFIFTKVFFKTKITVSKTNRNTRNSLAMSQCIPEALTTR